MDLKLKNKTALVTGSSRGLGYATAYLLAQEGARVIINGRNPEKLEAARQRIQKETGSQAAAFAGDLADPAFPDQLVHKAATQWDGLDILVTNAGGPPPGAFETLDDEAWDHAIQLSLLAHVRLIRAALPYLKKSTAASVLAVTSYSVKQPIPKLILSNSVRSATIGLIKTLALEVGNQGIRFNAILPGWTKTERVDQLLDARAQASGRTTQEELDLQMQDSPLKRMAQPEEFANAAVFLVSPAASYITGHMLTVDGGMYKGTF